MKFAKYLAENSVPEWRSRYVNYRLLKKEIKKVLAARQDALHAGTEVPLASTEDEIVINTSPEGSSDDLVHARKPAYLRTRSNTVDSHLALTDDEGLRLLLEEANLAEADIHFFKVLDRELQKADRFYQSEFEI
ncbi:SPX domain-containing protein [Phlyctochytrium arcticum]|nr:SPX domain-containing protein [Phlyctochytrium arcticum]